MIYAVIILSVLCLVLAVLACPTILALVLRPALARVDGTSRRWRDSGAALVGLVADLVAARTVWPKFAGPMQPGERTISDSLERLCKDVNNPDWALYYALSRRINRASPTGKHIKAA